MTKAIGIRNRFFMLKAFLKTMKTFLIALLIATSLIMGCGRDQVDLPDEPLQGTLAGQEWTYKSANAFLQSSDFLYKVTFLSTEESVSDPCALRSTGNPHVAAFMRFPDFSGDYTISPQVLNNNEVVVTFNPSISESFTATSGFMSIFAVENQVALGYLQAVLDNGNTVEGSIEIRICN